MGQEEPEGKSQVGTSLTYVHALGWGGEGR